MNNKKNNSNSSHPGSALNFLCCPSLPPALLGSGHFRRHIPQDYSLPNFHSNMSCLGLFGQDTQLMLTHRATRLEVSEGHQTWYHSVCKVLSCIRPLSGTTFKVKRSKVNLLLMSQRANMPEQMPPGE